MCARARLFLLARGAQYFSLGLLKHSQAVDLHSREILLVEQINAKNSMNRSDGDTSIKFGTYTLQNPLF